MTTHRRHVVHGRDHRHTSFWVVYILSVIFNFHGLIVAFSHSTYLENYLTPSGIGAVYTISSSISVFAFLFISRILRKLGNVKLTLGLAVAEIIALILIGMSGSAATVIVASVIFLIINPLIYLTIDIFSESLIGKDESGTGSKRGLTLTLMSIASVCAPLAIAIIVGTDDSNLNHTYFYAAGIFISFIGLVAYKFRDFKDPKYREVQVLSAMHSFWVDNNIRNVFLAHFVLQIFFSWMTIYFPLYLAIDVGLNWQEIGSIIAVGLLAYVICEYPIGVIADRWLGEKEMMAVGFLILAIAASTISLFAAASVAGWMALMFISRIGGSLVEVTTESYFFKHTKGTDAKIISFFRLTRPLSSVIGALLGSAALLYLPFNMSFIILGLLMLPGVYFALHLQDTK